MQANRKTREGKKFHVKLADLPCFPYYHHWSGDVSELTLIEERHTQMIPADLEYLKRLVSQKVITGPVLELGTGYGSFTSREIITSAGLKYVGTDIQPNQNVDYVADFENAEDMNVFRSVAPFGTILILNVLEHTFDPIRILDNAKTLLGPKGVIVTITPAVWPLHSYPSDFCRLLPNFYEEYCKRRNLRLLPQYFDYIAAGPVTSFINPDKTYRFPPPYQPGLRSQFSRMIHVLFNTFGRGMHHGSFISIGAVFQLGGDPT